MMATVSLAKAGTRYETVSKALSLIQSDIEASVKGKKRIVLKPNLVDFTNQLCATHVDTVRATLDFLRKFTSERIVIAEGSSSNTKTAYRNYGYDQLSKEYGVELIDLNDDEPVEMQIYDRNFNEITVQVARTMVEADYRVSLAIPKTHDDLIVSLSIKNIVVGSACASDNKWKFHQGYPAMNVNMYKVVQNIPPNLAIIDGWIGMEGDGPVKGTPVEMGVALASIDFVAVDTIAAYLMGFDPTEIGYLTYAKEKLGVGDLSKIRILGEDIEPLRRRFRPHRDYSEQRKWKLPPTLKRENMEENRRI